MYHPFNTKTECETALESLHWAMAYIAKSHGFMVIPGTFFVIGKNAQTGQDNPQSITNKWSDPIEMEDGRWSIPSFRSQFSNTFQQLEEGLPDLEYVYPKQTDEEDQ